VLWMYCVRRALQNHVDSGYFAIMTLSYGITALLFFRKYRRFTPGIIATSIGFLSWAAVAPLTYWFLKLPMGLPVIQDGGVSPQSFILAIGLSNVPKFIVAIGMIVALLEDER